MNQVNTKISFIVPIYNVEKYLEMTIRSILEQDYPNIELILINDGSPDNCDEICKEFQSRDSRVKYIVQKNQGVSVARNRGLTCATGDWICFVDGDDFVEPEICSALIEYLSDEIDILFFSYNEFILGDKKSHCDSANNSCSFTQKDFEQMQLAIFYMQGFKYTNPAAIWGKLFRTPFIREHNLQFLENQIKSQDTLFMLYVLQYARLGAYINRSLYNYRIIRESISRRYNPNIFDIYKMLLKQFRLFVSDCKYDCCEFAQAYEYRVLRNFMVATTLDCCHIDNENKYSLRRKKFLNELEKDPFCIALKNIDIKKYPPKERILAFCVKNRNFFMVNALNKIRYVIRKMG